MKAMTIAVDRVAAQLGHPPGHVLVDGNRLPRWGYAATPLVGGDALSRSIAAASIVAKHTRDRIMIAHAETWPHYGWHANKGYGAPDHLRALREHGPAPIHRRSFAPVAQAELPFGRAAELPSAIQPAAESFESHHNG
jgi:ribonuclease HII